MEELLNLLEGAEAGQSLMDAEQGYALAGAKVGYEFNSNSK